LQITETKTDDTHRRRKPAHNAKIQRPTAWRPEPSGLSRAELRQIVLDTLG
jgi:hypothetical protein